MRQAMGQMRPADLSRLTGESQTNIGRYFKGREPSLSFVAAFCLKLNVSPTWLILGRGPMRMDDADLSAVSDETILAEAHARQTRLLDQVKRAVRQIADAEASAPIAARPSKAGRRLGYAEIPAHDVPTDHEWQDRYVPIIDAVAAGNGLASVGGADDFPPGWAESFVEFAGAPAGSFAVRVAGRSMTPQFQDGDLAIVDPARPAVSGRPAVVVFQDRNHGRRVGRIKVFRKRGRKVVLESTAAGHDPIELDAADVTAAYAIAVRLPKFAD